MMHVEKTTTKKSKSQNRPVTANKPKVGSNNRQQKSKQQAQNNSNQRPKTQNNKISVASHKNKPQNNKISVASNNKVPVTSRKDKPQNGRFNPQPSVRKDPAPNNNNSSVDKDKQRNAEILMRALKARYGGNLSMDALSTAGKKIMDHVYGKLNNFLKFARPSGTDSPWENRGWFRGLSGYGSNVHDIYTATTPNQPGWMDPGHLSDYIEKLGQNLKRFKSLDQAAAAIRGQINPMGQTPTFVLPDNYKNNPFRLHTDNKNLRSYLVTAIGHDTGRQAFINDMNLLGQAFSQKFGSKRINIGDNSIGKLRQAFDRIAKEAQANPDKPYKAIYAFSGHGNVGMIQGNGGSGFYKRQLQQLFDRYKHVKNLAFTPIVEACHSGSFLGRRNA